MCLGGTERNQWHEIKLWFAVIYRCFRIVIPSNNTVYNRQPFNSCKLFSTLDVFLTFPAPIPDEEKKIKALKAS